MNGKIGNVFVAGVVVAALAGTASAQNATGTAAIDASLRSAVERQDVPGVVALITDRKGVIYQGAFGVADFDRTPARGRLAVPHRVDDQGGHVSGLDAARRAGPHWP